MVCLRNKGQDHNWTMLQQVGNEDRDYYKDKKVIPKPQDVTVKLVAVIIYLAWASYYLFDNLYQNNMAPNSFSEKFVKLFWLLPFSSLLLWIFVRGYGLRFIPKIFCFCCAVRATNMLGIFRIFVIDKLSIACCLVCRESGFDKAEKILISRRLLFQLATGITSVCIIKKYEIKSQTMGIYLFAYGIIELVLICFEYPETLPNDWRDLTKHRKIMKEWTIKTNEQSGLIINEEKQDDHHQLLADEQEVP